MRLEREQVRCAWGVTRTLCRHRPGFPRAVCGDDDTRPQINGRGLLRVSLSLFHNARTEMTAGDPLDARKCPWLYYVGPGLFRAREQHRVEVLTPQCSPPTLQFISRGRHVCGKNGFSGIQTDAPDLRPGPRQ